MKHSREAVCSSSIRSSYEWGLSIIHVTSDHGMSMESEINKGCHCHRSIVAHDFNHKLVELSCCWLRSYVVAVYSNFSNFSRTTNERALLVSYYEKIMLRKLLQTYFLRWHTTILTQQLPIPCSHIYSSCSLSRTSFDTHKTNICKV